MKFKKFFYYFYHKLLKIAVPLLRIPIPKLFKGHEAFLQIPNLLKPNYTRPLIVVSPSILKSEYFDKLLRKLTDNKIEYTIYSNIKPNPTIPLVNEGKEIYIKNICDSIISIGGGSAIDIAKIIGALIASKTSEVMQLKGLLKAKGKPPFHIAVPTTVGSGSEATVASVIINEKTKDKFAISDPKIVPNVAILDYMLLTTLPNNIISTTGLDSLTHSIESLISRASTRFTTKLSLKSIDLIYNNLYNCYKNADIASLENMQLASFYAGVSFTRGFVGYVHALSHSLSGEFNIPHGYANAILLPAVLEYYGKSIFNKTALISDCLNLIKKSSSKQEKFTAVISWIRRLNSSMNIPSKFNLELSEITLDKLIRHALNEANPYYPVPTVLSFEDLKNIYHKVL